MQNILLNEIDSQGAVPQMGSFFAAHFLAFHFRSEIVWGAVTNSVVYLFTRANALLESPPCFQNIAQWMNFPFRSRQTADVCCERIGLFIYHFIFPNGFQTYQNLHSRKQPTAVPQIKLAVSCCLRSDDLLRNSKPNETFDFVHSEYSLLLFLLLSRFVVD